MFEVFSLAKEQYMIQFTIIDTHVRMNYSKYVRRL
jgi:hypothetical protein